MLNDTPFTSGWKEVMRQSRIEAEHLGHEYIGPEHFLLGIIRKSEGLAVTCLENLKADPESLLHELKRQLKIRKDLPIGLFQQNSEAHRVMDNSKLIANKMNHHWVGTEHLLLAILKEQNCIAAKFLMTFGLNYDRIEKEVLNLIEGGQIKSTPKPADNMILFTPEISPLVKVVMKASKDIAKKNKHPQLMPEHIILGLCQHPDGLAGCCLRNLGLDFNKLQLELNNNFSSCENLITTAASKIDEEFWLNISTRISSSMKDSWIGTEHLLLAVLEDENAFVTKRLEDYGINRAKIISELLKLRKP